MYLLPVNWLKWRSSCSAAAVPVLYWIAKSTVVNPNWVTDWLVAVLFILPCFSSRTLSSEWWLSWSGSEFQMRWVVLSCVALGIKFSLVTPLRSYWRRVVFACVRVCVCEGAGLGAGPCRAAPWGGGGGPGPGQCRVWEPEWQRPGAGWRWQRPQHTKTQTQVSVSQQ